jgi:N-formylglutamate deformylase
MIADRVTFILHHAAMTTTSVFQLEQRSGPLLISIPHVGTHIPDALKDDYSPLALTVPDTDWHLDKLYAFAARLGATVISARLSRYVVDVNRPASGESLYPGMVTTDLCPLETFSGEAVYREGHEPSAGEVSRRVESYWRPYHAALQQEIARLRALHPRILVWEAHSISSVVPRLFSGKLPDFCFGTADGQSCGEQVIAGALAQVRKSDASWVVNGRFKGGYITRRYGAPVNGVHGVQLEMCQSLYMDEVPPFRFRPDLSERVAPIVQACVEGALAQLGEAKAATQAEGEGAHILSA